MLTDGRTDRRTQTPFHNTSCFFKRAYKKLYILCILTFFEGSQVASEPRWSQETVCTVYTYVLWGVAGRIWTKTKPRDCMYCIYSSQNVERSSWCHISSVRLASCESQVLNAGLFLPSTLSERFVLICTLAFDAPEPCRDLYKIDMQSIQ